MTQDEIIEKLKEMMKQISREKVEWDKVSPESEIQSLGFDSLAILDLIYDIQQEFNVEFEAEEMSDVKTVGKLAEFLQQKGA